MAIKTIARMLGASRNCVRRWLRAGAFVPYRRAPAASRLDAHLRFIDVRLQDGQHNAAGVYRELRAIGFEGGYVIVQRWAKRRRQRPPTRPPSARVPSTRRIARWLTSDPASLPPEDRHFVAALCGLAPRLQAAAEQVRGFDAILRARDPAALKPWLEVAAASELGGFGAGLRQDEAAVHAAIGEPWSNGVVEGQMNRLKLIKRSMYGRACLDCSDSAPCTPCKGGQGSARQTRSSASHRQHRTCRRTQILTTSRRRDRRRLPACSCG